VTNDEQITFLPYVHPVRYNYAVFVTLPAVHVPRLLYIGYCPSSRNETNARQNSKTHTRALPSYAYFTARYRRFDWPRRRRKNRSYFVFIKRSPALYRAINSPYWRNARALSCVDTVRKNTTHVRAIRIVAHVYDLRKSRGFLRRNMINVLYRFPNYARPYENIRTHSGINYSRDVHTYRSGAGPSLICKIFRKSLRRKLILSADEHTGERVIKKVNLPVKWF